MYIYIYIIYVRCTHIHRYRSISYCTCLSLFYTLCVGNLFRIGLLLKNAKGPIQGPIQGRVLQQGFKMCTAQRHMGFPYMGYPQMDGEKWEIPVKWMILGYWKIPPGAETLSRTPYMA